LNAPAPTDNGPGEPRTGFQTTRETQPGPSR
jgi:hypothetical protein